MYKFFGSIILCCCVWSSGGLALNCVKTDDCSSLGYKQTSVDNDLPKLKCPHGEGYYYSCNNTFKYTCTNQAESPSGKECLGLYEKCNCEKGYIWLYGKCQKTCEIGDIYYIDGTCGSADEYDKSKKVLGVVVYLNASKIHGLIMAAVAEEMKELSQSEQVIAITHLPQIASRADSHYLVEKEEKDGRTMTRIRAVAGEERVKEIARLLSGETSDLSLRHARALLEVQDS